MIQNAMTNSIDGLREGRESCPLRTWPQDDSISLRDMEAGGSTLESGSSGFSVSGRLRRISAELPELAG